MLQHENGSLLSTLSDGLHGSLAIVNVRCLRICWLLVEGECTIMAAYLIADVDVADVPMF